MENYFLQSKTSNYVCNSYIINSPNLSVLPVSELGHKAALIEHTWINIESILSYKNSCVVHKHLFCHYYKNIPPVSANKQRKSNSLIITITSVVIVPVSLHKVQSRNKAKQPRTTGSIPPSGRTERNNEQTSNYPGENCRKYHNYYYYYQESNAI